MDLFLTRHLSPSPPTSCTRPVSFHESGGGGGGGGGCMEYTCVMRCPSTPCLRTRKYQTVFPQRSALSHWHTVTCSFKTNIPASVPRMSVSLPANQGSLNKRREGGGGALWRQCFDRVLLTCLVSTEDLRFSKENTKVHSPKSGPTLSNSCSCSRAVTVKAQRRVLSACKYCGTLPVTATQATKVQVIPQIFALPC